MEPLIQLRNLEKVVEAGPNKFFLLRRINLDIQAGYFVTIMGPSGAGKSTLLSIVGMLDGAWTGDYYFLGEPVHKLNVKKRNERKHRIRVSELSPDRQFDGLRKSGSATFLQERPAQGARQPRLRHA